MRITVVGAGALGGLLGALLARAGHAVSFVAQGASLAALRTDGVVVASPAGTFATGPLVASSDPADLGPADLVIVAVKSWQVKPLAPSLAPLVGPGAVVLPVQNGVEAADHLAAALGDEAVVGGLCYVIAVREAPGRVRTMGQAAQITLGERGGRHTGRADRAVEALRGAGMDVTVSPAIDVASWSKFVFIEPFGSVGAVSRSPAEIVRAVPETRALLERAMREVQAVAAGRGVVVPDSAVASALARIDALPPGATASMQRDLAEGRPSELDEQTGAVVRLARAAGVACPVHDFLWASLRPQDPRLRAL